MNPSADLFRLILAYRTSQAIHVAAVLGISDLLADGPRPLDALAEATGSQPRSLYRLLRALAATGLYEELPDGRFQATELGAELRRDSPSQLGNLATFIGQSAMWQAWGSLEHSVRTGDSAFAFLHGQSAWQYHAEHPVQGAIFNAAMTAQSLRITGAVLDAYDFSGIATLADIAGGRGAMLAAVLVRNPAMRGVLFDQPHVVADAPALLAEAGVADRCEVVAGDMFDSIPDGADAYLMKSIVHDWPDEAAVEILNRCRTAMRPGVPLLIIERLVGAPPYSAADAPTAISDLNMLVGPGGQERTRVEFEALLARAGLRLSRVVATTSDMAVIEAFAKL